MIIDMKTTMCKFDERCEALCHVDRASEVIGNLPRIYIFDRGYPSGPFLIDIMNRGERFIIRLPSTVFKTGDVLIVRVGTNSTAAGGRIREREFVPRSAGTKTVKPKVTAGNRKPD